MCHVRFDARRCTTCRQAYCVWTNRVRRLRVRLGLRRSLRRRARAWGACGSSWRTRWRESAGTCLACIAATVAPPAAYWRAEVEQADRKGGDEEMEAAPPAPSGNGGVRGRGADDVAADPVDEDVEIGRVMARWFKRIIRRSSKPLFDDQQEPIMAEKKQLHLTAFMRPVSLHTGAWRYPGAYPDANFNLTHLKSFIKKLEDAKFDAFFMADHLAVLNMPTEALKRSHTVTSFEPFTLLSALSVVTDKIGLAATASTTYDEPYHIARRFASLDHLSGGRAAWNIVTTGNPESSKNFGRDEHMEHGDRYKRAREFYDVVTGLWDSFADDAFVRDQESGVYFDPEKLHVLDHKGESLKVRGPLNIARPVQGWPVIIQAGQSDPGRQLAAETAEAVFCSPRDLASAKALYADIKGRAVAAGRNPNHLKILPAALIVIGDTVEDARAKRLKLDSLVHYDSAIASLSVALGTDASGFDPDGPLPTDLPETNASKTGRAGVLQLAEDEKLTVRQLAQRYGGYSGLAFVGPPEAVADQIETWLAEDAADGFTVTFPFLPQGLDDVVQRLVPELQRRGIFRKEYEGTTLREHLGLPRPKNRFF